MKIPERHLGLTVAQERFLTHRFINRLGRLIAEHVDLDRLLARARSKMAAPVASPRTKAPTDKVPIAVASDQAFCFYYPDNLELLRNAGAQIKNFSPIRDRRLPAGVKGIYLGGGYPELYARELARNRPLRVAIRTSNEFQGE